MNLFAWLRWRYQDGQSKTEAKIVPPADYSSQSPAIQNVANKAPQRNMTDHPSGIIADSRSSADTVPSCPHGSNRFADVLNQVEVKSITKLATQVRIRKIKSMRSSTFTFLRPLRLSCKVLSPPLSGSYNILFPIRFKDGLEWLLKVPANGCDGWDEQSARALTSEVLTMKYLFNHSAIPVPRIHSFDSSSTNAIRCPYILMERIDGTPLHYGWYGDGDGPGSLDRFRERTLNDIAKAMVQLENFAFPSAGALQYNAKDKRLDVGVYRKVDHYAENDRVRLGDDEDLTTFSEHGPFAEPKDYFLSSLEKSDATELSHTLQSYRKLLRLLIVWFFEATGEDSLGFVLAHPDFNLQNILVGDDGSLQGLVDWDGVVAVPRCIGCGAYPLWLTPDWDPLWWSYDANKDSTVDEDGDPIMTPNDLDKYRSIYARSIEEALRTHSSQNSLSHSNSLQCGPAEQPQYSCTKLSSLARSLYIAANEPLSLPYNIPMILDKIIDLTEEEEYEDSAVEISTDARHELNHVTEEGEEESSIAPNPPNAHITGIEDSGMGVWGKLSLSKVKKNLTAIMAHISHKGMSTLTKLEATTENATEPETDISVTAYQYPRTTSLLISQQQQHHDISPLIYGWPRLPSTCSPFLLTCFLVLPAYFVLLMDWIQSFDIFPTAILFASLLTTTYGLMSQIAVLALGGVLFARILDETLHGRAYGHWTFKVRKIIKVPNEHQSVVRYEEASLPAGGNSHAAIDGGLDSGGFQLEMAVHHAFPKAFSRDDRAVRTQPHTNDIIHSNVNVSDMSSHARMSHHSSTASVSSTHASTDPTSAPDEHAAEDLEARIRRIWAEDPLYDFGHFTSRNVLNALYTDTLDEERLARLKRGFGKLLGTLDERYKGLGGGFN
ncbi:MAG: hypothetical protein Q9209_003885 [Squamulea sp. 1 TL-2023]